MGPIWLLEQTRKTAKTAQESSCLDFHFLMTLAVRKLKILNKQ
jgi:hypothetical protein